MQTTDSSLETEPGSMSLVASFHSSLNYHMMVETGFPEKWTLSSLDVHQSMEMSVIWMAMNWLSAADPGAGLPVWVPKQLPTYPRKMLQNRIGWLKRLAEREPLPPQTAWELLPEFAAQRDLREKVLSRKIQKRKAFKQKQSAKIKRARIEARVVPMTSELNQTVTLSLEQLVVLGNRFHKVKGSKATLDQQKDTNIILTVLSGMVLSCYLLEPRT